MSRSALLPALFVLLWCTGYLVVRIAMPDAGPVRFLAFRFGDALHAHHCRHGPHRDRRRTGGRSRRARTGRSAAVLRRGPIARFGDRTARVGIGRGMSLTEPLPLHSIKGPTTVD